MTYSRVTVIHSAIMVTSRLGKLSVHRLHHYYINRNKLYEEMCRDTCSKSFEYFGKIGKSRDLWGYKLQDIEIPTMKPLDQKTTQEV